MIENALLGYSLQGNYPGPWIPGFWSFLSVVLTFKVYVLKLQKTLV